MHSGDAATSLASHGCNWVDHFSFYRSTSAFSSVHEQTSWTLLFRNFTNRHHGKLRFVRPLAQEAVRFKAVNSDVLTSHFATLEKVVEQYDIDATRIWNCDETATTPGRDADGKQYSPAYVTRSGSTDVKLGQFVNNNRVTILPAVSASGEQSPALFVFKGVRVPYRSTRHDGVDVVQTYADFLPNESIISRRAEGGGVDGSNFFKWAVVFIEHAKPLTAGGRNVLLIFDGYRSHMTLRVIELFHMNNVIVCALPPHTSGKTKPLDVTVFSVFKKQLAETIQ